MEIQCGFVYKDEGISRWLHALREQPYQLSNARTTHQLPYQRTPNHAVKTSAPCTTQETPHRPTPPLHHRSGPSAQRAPDLDPRQCGPHPPPPPPQQLHPHSHPHPHPPYLSPAEASSSIVAGRGGVERGCGCGWVRACVFFLWRGGLGVNGETLSRWAAEFAWLRVWR